MIFSRVLTDKSEVLSLPTELKSTGSEQVIRQLTMQDYQHMAESATCQVKPNLSHIYDDLSVEEQINCGYIDHSLKQLDQEV